MKKKMVYLIFSSCSFQVMLSELLVTSENERAIVVFHATGFGYGLRGFVS
jgi:hypothetical protein